MSDPLKQLTSIRKRAFDRSSRLCDLLAELRDMNYKGVTGGLKGNNFNKARRAKTFVDLIYWLTPEIEHLIINTKAYDVGENNA